MLDQVKTVTIDLTEDDDTNDNAEDTNEAADIRL